MADNFNRAYLIERLQTTESIRPIGLSLCWSVVTLKLPSTQKFDA